MADIRKFQTHEVLNKVLNTGEDALKVDIDNVTLTTEGGDVAIDVALDKANDSVLHSLTLLKMVVVLAMLLW